MIELGVNIDHVATVRQARYRDIGPDAGEPDPVRAAHEAELGGADGITLHLREDRRHIQDRDVKLLRRIVNIRFNLEMAATEEMIDIACRVKPHTAMFVPEGREEVTTEGGLDVAGRRDELRSAVKQLHDEGILVSAFIDPSQRQVEAAATLGFDVCEVHTGPYASAFHRCGGDFRRDELQESLKNIREVGRLIRDAGMRFNAGHALNYHNVTPVASCAGISELHIGHAIISRAIFVGLRTAVRDMKSILDHAGLRQP